MRNYSLILLLMHLPWLRIKVCPSGPFRIRAIPFSLVAKISYTPCTSSFTGNVVCP